MVCTPFPCWFVIETNLLEFTPHRLYRPVLTRNSTSHNNDRIKKIMLDPVASHHAVTMAYCFDSKTRADIFFFLSSTCFLHLMTYWRVPIIAQHGHMTPKLSSSQKKCSDNQHKVSSTNLHIYICTLTCCSACPPHSSASKKASCPPSRATCSTSTMSVGSSSPASSCHADSAASNFSLLYYYSQRTISSLL